MKKTITKLLTLLTLVLISITLLSTRVKAEGLTIEVSGLLEAPSDEMYQVDLLAISPTDVTSFSMTISYDARYFTFDSIESDYLIESDESVEEGQVSFSLEGQPIPAGSSQLASISFTPTDIGGSSIRILRASAFAQDGAIVRVDTSNQLYVSVVDGGSFIPLPNTPTPVITESQSNTPTPEVTTSVNTETSSTSSEVDLTFETTETLEDETEETTELTTIEETESTTELIETDSTTIEESSTIAKSETDEQQLTEDDENTSSADQNLMRMVWIPILILVLAAAILVSLFLTRKRNT